MNLWIAGIFGRFWGVIEEVEEVAEADDDADVEEVPMTEAIAASSGNISESTESEESAELADPGWDRKGAIRDVAYFLRAHKFRDYDRRYYRSVEDSPWRLFRDFPKPRLRSLHWEVHKYCDLGFARCLKYLEDMVAQTALRREDDTVTVIRRFNWNQANHSRQILSAQKDCEAAKKRDSRLVEPFEGPIERFQWRTSASYYMCRFTMLGIPDLAHFGESCANHANCLDEYGANNRDPRADDSKPFACALYSFCPDRCCPLMHVWYTKDCSQSTLNPCYDGNPPGRRECILKREENQNFASLALNQINVTCECQQSGYEWSSRYGICIDVNECTREKHNCSLAAGQTCFNLPGTYACICRLGLVYHPEKNSCVPSEAILKALQEVEEERNDTETKSLLALIVDAVTRSKAIGLRVGFEIAPFLAVVILGFYSFFPL
ncbi:uncharacterized protein LOC105700452 [Orussus abietinus]|uniref:uncharacterized protein LOC105700452 n=1 Tax=Orussus abietinus TaxID=222816 RepID=UPI000625CA73|nr:uncharacterized protein LOC105700452 [Orussus abietinus]